MFLKFFTGFVVLSFLIVGGAYAQEVPESHFLKVNSVPNILFIPGSGFYPEGTVVELDTVPERWNEYSFVGWKVNGVWSLEDSLTLRMDRSYDVEAVFEKSTQGNVLVDAIPRIAEITIDGEIYLPSELPVSLEWEAGSSHFLSIPNVVKEDPSTRYKFDSWKDNNSQTQRTVIIEAEEGNEFVALYRMQHYLKPISEKGSIVGGGWQDAGETASFSVESEIIVDEKDDAIRYVFNSWDTGDYPNNLENQIDVEEATTVKANWDTEYKLELLTNVPEYNLYGTGWYLEGKKVSLIAEEELESEDSKIRYVFDRWISRGPNPVIIPNAQSPFTTVTMDAPYILEAKYKKSFQVDAWTPYGLATGAGFYDEGETAEIRMTQTEVMVKPGKEKKIFNGWNTNSATTIDFENLEDDTTQNLLIHVAKPVNVTANWKTQYYLNLIASGGKVNGAGWYDSGKFVPISVDETSITKDFWTSYVFDGWSGSLEDPSPNALIKITEPMTIVAEWREDNNTGVFNVSLLGLAGVVGAVVFFKTRKNKLLAKFGRHTSHEHEQNPFEKYEEKALDYEYQESMQKPKKKMVMDWLLGRHN